MIPVPLATQHVFTTAANIAVQLHALHEISATAFGDTEHRVVVLPAREATLGDMYECARRVGSELGLPVGRCQVEEDPVITAIVKSWCTSVSYAKAERLGLPFDFDMDAVIRDFAQHTHHRG